MARIADQGWNDISDDSRIDGERTADGSIHDIDEVSHDPGSLSVDDAAALFKVQIRPWMLQLIPQADPQHILLDRVVSRELDPVLDASEGHVGTALAEMLVRLDSIISQSGDETLIAALDTLSDHLRMMQHLNLIRTETGG